MVYILALGNPGSEYSDTRHNAGWIIADYFCTHFNFPEPVFSAKYQGRVTEGVVGTESVTVLYPDSFMNHSGVAAKKLVPAGFENRLVVIYDEVMLPLGEHKVSFGRGDGGHNGIRSVVAALGTKDFARVRIGIAPRQFLTGKLKVITGEQLPRFVLGRFSKRELAELEKGMPTVMNLLETIIQHGVTVTMNRFN